MPKPVEGMAKNRVEVAKDDDKHRGLVEKARQPYQPERRFLGIFVAASKVVALERVVRAALGDDAAR